MKNLNILTLVMTAMVYAASHPNPKKILIDPQLQQIREAADDLSRNATKPANISWITTDDGTVCVCHFFCLAERALRQAGLQESNLCRALHVYNNQTHNTTCPEALNQVIKMSEFLHNVKKCAKHAMTHWKEC